MQPPLLRHLLRPSALTLVELLVAAAIALLLVGLLIPAVGRGIDAANASRCLSSQKKVAHACLAFAADNQGQLPVAYAQKINEETGQGSFDSSWYFDIEPYMGSPASVFTKQIRCRAESRDKPLMSVGVHAGQPGAQGSGPMVQGTNISRRRLAAVPASILLTADTYNNVGTFLNPADWPMTIDQDSDGIKDSHGSSKGSKYNVMQFRHGGQAIGVCADGSARHLTVEAWVTNEGNLWGKKTD